MQPHPQGAPIIAVNDSDAVGHGYAVADAHAAADRQNAHTALGYGGGDPRGDQRLPTRRQDRRLINAGVKVQRRRADGGVVGQRDAVPDLVGERFD